MSQYVDVSMGSWPIGNHHLEDLQAGSDEGTQARMVRLMSIDEEGEAPQLGFERQAASSCQIRWMFECWSRWYVLLIKSVVSDACQRVLLLRYIHVPQWVPANG